MKAKITYKNTTVLKHLLLFFISIALLSCDSDDSSIDPSQLLSNFQEPNLNFRISPEELKMQEGEPDLDNGFFFTYLNPQNAVTEYRYVILTDFLTQEPFYAHVNVDIYANQQNLDYIVNWLTDKYGTPEFSQFGDGSQGYEWFLNTEADDDLFNISIVYSGDGIGTEETFLVDFSLF
ncbi:hypothetical protein [Winogradskyella sp.]|uniref:hypothetical protein n=1 Tax=Winogradskyella sp. TaxID=1883156 RepID=UPI003BAAD2F6